MEFCMEAKALKSSLRRELAVKSTQQALIEEFWCATGIAGVPTDDFSVDDLLDLSNGQFEDGYVEEIEEEEEEEEEEEKDSVSVDDENSNSSNFVSADSECSLASQLLVPDDNLAELEWVSHFVDDSLSDLSLLHPVGTQTPEALLLNQSDQSEPELKPVQSRPSWFPSQIPVKPRTKRSRPASRVWSSSSSPSSPSSCSSGFSVSTPCLIFTNPARSMVVFGGEPPAKKEKKQPAVQTGLDGAVSGVQFQRRCSHCQVQKTPQWRTGPLGAKTLCNACGVRFKSGRLFPEYRPACSPTFSGDVHSNSHRKVLEMRRKKEVGSPEPGWNRMTL